MWILTTEDIKEGEELIHVKLAGPTCAGDDVIKEDILLPKLKVGSVLAAYKMGAYTMSTHTTFNSMKVTNVLYINQ